MSITRKDRGDWVVGDLTVLDDLTVDDDVSITGDIALAGSFAVGTTGAGADFTCWGAVAAYKTWWDADGDTNGAWYFGANTKGVLVTLYGAVTGCGVFFDPDGDTNGILSVGASGGSKGNDFLAYGNTDGNYLHWDQSGDDLLLVGTATQFAVAGTDDATNSTSGSIRTAGGMGVAKKLFVGTDLDVDGTTNLDNVDIDGTFTLNTTTAVLTCSTSVINYTPIFTFGYDVGAAMTFTTTDTSGAVAITHAGSGTAITWTAASLAFTGNFSSDGATAVLDGSTSARLLSAGFVSVETSASDFRVGYDSSIYTKFAVANTSGNLTITHVGGSTDAVTWTAAGGFDFVGAMVVDGLTVSGNVTVSDNATDLVIIANTVAALEIKDSATILVNLDTRNTVSGIEPIALNPGAGEVPDGAGNTRNGVVVKSATATCKGTTGITTAFDGLSFKVEVPTIAQDGGAVVVDKASTMYIAGAPTAGASVTITAGYALEIEAGASLFGGDVKFDGALDFIVDGNTAAAFELYDSTTKLIAIDTRNTVTGVEVIAFNPGAATLPDSAATTRNGVVIKSATSTLVGTTGVTTAFDGLSFQVEVPTIAQSGGAVVVDKASTMYIAGPPTAGASVTITAPYAFEIGGGDFLTAGDIYVTGGEVYIGTDTVAGTLTLYPTTGSKGITTYTMADNAGATTTNINVAEQAGARTYTVPDAGASATFLMTDSYKTWWSFACGLSGEDTDGAGTNGGGITGGAVDIATNMFNDGAGTVFCKVFDQSMDTGSGVWDDLSTSATLDAWAANYQLTPDAASEAANDAFAVGFATKFCELCFDDLATGAGALATWSGASGKWQYSKTGDTWGDLTTIHDNTDSVDQTGGQPLVRTGAISFAPPSDWTSNTIDGQDAYWVKYLIENATLTQAALIDATAKDEPMVVVPNADAFDAPFKATIGEIRVTDVGVTVHDAAIQFVVGNFTTGVFTEEFTWTASQYNDTFTPATPLTVAANDKVGVLITDDAGSTVNPVLYVELEATYLD